MAERFDLDAIDADDALLDLLAAGGDSAWEAGEHDPALKLLADLRLAVEVEDELPVETIDDPESFLARCAALNLNPVMDPFARKVAARSLAVGVAAVAALSVSGVAAAVTGDPLSPYEKVIEKVVDAVRPQTSSFPKEQLDGMPVVDKTKIVKVAKDFQQKRQEAKVADEKLNDALMAGGLTDVVVPPLLRPTPPLAEKPALVKDTLTPQVEEKPVDQPTTEPTVVQPTEPTVVQPTEQPATTTTPPPSEDPPAIPNPAPTEEPTEVPTTPPQTETGSTDSGSTGNPGQTPGELPSSDPTTAPPQTSGETSTGDTGGAPTGGTEQTAPSDQTGEQSSDQPAGDAVVPVPSGDLSEQLTRLEQSFGKGNQTSARHSNGKQLLGYAKAQYDKGKHSTGQYAEGKHAAIGRAHGSMAPVTLRQILTVLNGPMTSR